VTAHVLHIDEQPAQLTAACGCGAPLLSIQWTGADRDAVLARFRAGAADAHRRHLAIEALAAR